MLNRPTLSVNRWSRLIFYMVSHINSGNEPVMSRSQSAVAGYLQSVCMGFGEKVTPLVGMDKKLHWKLSADWKTPNQGTCGHFAVFTL